MVPGPSVGIYPPPNIVTVTSGGRDTLVVYDLEIYFLYGKDGCAKHTVRLQNVSATQWRHTFSSNNWGKLG